MSNPDACWPWTGKIDRDGYGKFFDGKRQVGAHIWAFKNWVSPVIEHTVDHTCHNHSTCPGGQGCLHRRCVNPRHLRDATVRDNTLAGRAFTAKNALTTHCPEGHEYTDANTYRYRGGRGCRTCRSTKAAAWIAANRDLHNERRRATRARRRASQQEKRPTPSAIPTDAPTGRPQRP